VRDMQKSGCLKAFLGIMIAAIIIVAAITGAFRKEDQPTTQPTTQPVSLMDLVHGPQAAVACKTIR